MPIKTRQLKKAYQYLLSIGLVLLVAILSFYSIPYTGYKVVALLLLMTVSVLAMLFDILPVLLASALSALLWNYFFIPPVFTFHIDNAEDFLMFLLYFFIASVNATLTFKIRKEENKVRDKEEKEKTIQLYNTLLNSLSHELRTPISTIVGAVDTLQENKVKLSVANQTALLNEIETAGWRLDRQVENLLNMSRLETGTLKPHFDWCDLNELISDVINKISVADNHSIEFTPNDQLPLFKLDRGLMYEAIKNILHNALQYTPDKTKISLEASLVEDHCTITISDHGKGIASEETPFVFNKFYRVPNTKTGGSGLGLSIVKGFVEAQKGKIELSNTPGGGATFTISINAETSYLSQLKNE